jgi:tRNA(Ile)-lysidine synthase
MLEKIQKKLTFIPHEEKIAVACSGGSDSLALVEILLALGRKIIILIVDHKMRPESSSEAALVKSWLEKKAPVEIVVWEEGSLVKSNLQAKAREARYQLLLDCCHKIGIKFLATAHHKADQAETLFLNIMRGSGIKGLVGIREKSMRGDIMILRPLLEENKEALKEYLLQKNLPWIEDPSNNKDCYERVKIRKFLASLVQTNLLSKNKLEDRLILLSQNAERNQLFIEKYLHKLTEKILTSYQLVKIIDWGVLAQEEEEIIFLFFQRILSKTIRLKSIKLLYEAITNNKITSLGGFIFHKIENKLFAVVQTKQASGQKIIVKNQVKRIKTFLLQGKYEIVEEKNCYEVIKLVKMIPRLDFLSGLPYQILDNKMIIPDLGVSIDRF